jgi:hypothetical protein
MSELRTVSLTLSKEDWATIYGTLGATATFTKQPRLAMLATVIRKQYKATYPHERKVSP